MKKQIAIALLLTLLLSGCSTGVSQEKYDAVLAERDAAIAENAALKDQLNSAIPESTAADNEKAETTTPTATEPPADDLADSLEIETLVWHKHYINADYYHNDLLVTNTSQYMIEADFTIKYYDENDNVIGVSNVDTEALGPGETHYIEARNELPFARAELFSVKATADDRYKGSMAEVECVDYSVSGSKVMFEVTNNGDIAVEFVKAYAVFYDGDEIVDVDYSYATDDDNELKPGATELSELNTNKTFTSYRIFYYGRYR